MHLAATAALACTLVLLGPWGAARACSCLPPPPPGDAMAQAEVVFEGRTFSREAVGEVAVSFGFEVVRVWKGEVAASVAIQTPANSAMCGRDFELGTRYLVYASDRQGVLTDNLCSRTRALSSASEDLLVLGEGRAPVTRTPVPPSVEPPRVAPTQAEPPPHARSERGCRMGEELGLSWAMVAAWLRRRHRRMAQGPARGEGLPKC